MKIESAPQDPRSESQEFSDLLETFSIKVKSFTDSSYLETNNQNAGDIPLSDETKIMATHTVALTLFLIERSSFKDISYLDKSKNLGINIIGFLLSRIAPRTGNDDISLPMFAGPRTEEREKEVFDSYVLAPARRLLEDLPNKKSLPLTSMRDLCALMSKCDSIINAISVNKDSLGLNIDRSLLNKIHEHLFKVENPLFEVLRSVE